MSPKRVPDGVGITALESGINIPHGGIIAAGKVPVYMMRGWEKIKWWTKTAVFCTFESAMQIECNRGYGGAKWTKTRLIPATLPAPIAERWWRSKHLKRPIGFVETAITIPD
jgi:hypothetical protein